MILAVSGSLRRSSINSAALRAAASAAAQDGITVTLSDAVRHLPHFDPDLETAPPRAAIEFRSACDQASGVLIAVPEYAFGIPGAFKNALDWTVGSGSLDRKPVAVIDVAPRGRGQRAREALDHVLRAVGAHVVHYPVAIPPTGRDVHGEITDLAAIRELRRAVAELARADRDDRHTAVARVAQDALRRR